MLLPLAAIGTSLVIAQSVVAGVSELFGLGVSNQSIILLSAIIAGAGTDYAVFLISRYHDYLRQGADLDDAVRRALISIGKVITASAATVGVTFLGISFARMGVFSTVGVACAIGVGVAYLAAMTLLPAILVLAGPRGWIKPRRELTARFWRRSGIRIVRRPQAAPGRQPARPGPSRQLRDLGALQLRRSQGRGTLGPEFGRVRRDGTPFPRQSGRARVHPRSVTARPAHTAGPRGPGADGATGQPTAEHRSCQRPHPTHRSGAAGVQSHLPGGHRR